MIQDGETFMTTEEFARFRVGYSEAMRACFADLQLQVRRAFPDFVRRFEATGEGDGVEEVLSEFDPELRALTVTWRLHSGRAFIASAPIVIPDAVH